MVTQLRAGHVYAGRRPDEFYVCILGDEGVSFDRYHDTLIFGQGCSYATPSPRDHVGQVFDSSEGLVVILDDGKSLQMGCPDNLRRAFAVNGVDLSVLFGTQHPLFKGLKTGTDLAGTANNPPAGSYDKPAHPKLRHDTQTSFKF